MARGEIAGTLAAAVSPLRDNGERLDEEAFEPLLEFYSESGIEGLLVLGTTGEGILLEAPERRRVAELAVGGARDLRIIVHCGAQTTTQTSALAAHAADAGGSQQRRPCPCRSRHVRHDGASGRHTGSVRRNRERIIHGNVATNSDRTESLNNWSDRIAGQQQTIWASPRETSRSLRPACIPFPL